jgi:acyl-CoA thioester hydrolase
MKLPRINTVSEFFKRFPVITRLPVQWGEMDAFQHVNNVVYFKYQESSRIRFFRAITDEINDSTFDADAFHRGIGLGPILSDTSVKFIYPLVAPDTVLVGAQAHMLEASSSRFLIKHSVWSLALNRVVAEGTGTVASFNYSTGKSQPFDPLVIAAIHGLADKNCSHLEDELAKMI